MHALILAAILSYDQTLKEFEVFCSNAEIEVGCPITSETVKPFRTRHEDEARIQVADRYSLGYDCNKVREFQDLKESGIPKLNHLDPAEMQSWSEEKCLIDEDGAKQIATRLFHRLGFDDRLFDPVEVHRYSWQPDEAIADHVLWLPLFWVNWRRKAFHHDSTGGPCVQMDISGTTRKLVNYLDCTHDDIPFFGFTEELQPLQHRTPATNAPPVSPTTATPVERFFEATGIKPPKDWRQQTQATDPPPPTFVQVEDRYLFRLQSDSVREFGDGEQNFTLLAMKRGHASLSNWFGVGTIVTETQAVQIATQFLGRLGFGEQSFCPAEVTEDEAVAMDPVRGALPVSYTVRWVGKRPPSVRSGLPDVVEIGISGATSNLVHYWYAPNTFHY
jgi:hypothetical protein